jgi:hypothetical protein
MIQDPMQSLIALSQVEIRTILTRPLVTIGMQRIRIRLPNNPINFIILRVAPSIAGLNLLLISRFASCNRCPVASLYVIFALVC